MTTYAHPRPGEALDATAAVFAATLAALEPHRPPGDKANVRAAYWPQRFPRVSTTVSWCDDVRPPTGTLARAATSQPGTEIDWSDEVIERAEREAAMAERARRDKLG